jgi:hypothetical protein
MNPPVNQETPVPVPPRLRPVDRRVWFALAGFFLTPLLIVVVSLATSWHLPFPQCVFKSVTGLPCFTCGTTRALAALGGLDLSEALRLNPLATVLLLAFPTGCAIRLLGIVLPQVGQRLPSLKLKPILVLGVAFGIANWLYLLRSLPR